MNIATGRNIRRIAVRMRVQPQHPQLAPRRAAMPRHRTERTRRQMMITPQHDRRAPFLQLRQHRVVHRLRPENCLRQIAQPRRLRITPATRIHRPRQIARIHHIHPQRPQRRRQLRHPQRIRPHRRPQAAGPHVRRRTDECNAVGGLRGEGGIRGGGEGRGHGAFCRGRNRGQKPLRRLPPGLWIHPGGRMGRGEREHSTEGGWQQTEAWGERLRSAKSNGRQGLAVGFGPAGPACLVRVS